MNHNTIPPQEGVIRPPEALQDGVPVQQVVMTTGEGDNACLTPGIQLDHIDHADNGACVHVDDTIINIGWAKTWYAGIRRFLIASLLV